MGCSGALGEAPDISAAGASPGGHVVQGQNAGKGAQRPYQLHDSEQVLDLARPQSLLLWTGDHSRGCWFPQPVCSAHPRGWLQTVTHKLSACRSLSAGIPWMEMQSAVGLQKVLESDKSCQIKTPPLPLRSSIVSWGSLQDGAPVSHTFTCFLPSTIFLPLPCQAPRNHLPSKLFATKLLPSSLLLGEPQIRQWFYLSHRG